MRMFVCLKIHYLNDEEVCLSVRPFVLSLFTTFIQNSSVGRVRIKRIIVLTEFGVSQGPSDNEVKQVGPVSRENGGLESISIKSIMFHCINQFQKILFNLLDWEANELKFFTLYSEIS